MINKRNSQILVRKQFKDIDPIWFDALYGKFDRNFNYTSEMWTKLNKVDLNRLMVTTRPGYIIHRQK